MKKIGLIGGISWISTADYYHYINQKINEELGGINFAECIIYSFNYNDIVNNNMRSAWDDTFKMILDACVHLKNSGAEAIILCANTMHIIAERLQQQLTIPIIHIAEVTAKEINVQKIKNAGLLGTKITMERDFFKEKLSAYQINTIIPEEEDCDFIHTTLTDELSKGIIIQSTKEKYLEIIDKLINRGAEGIILGCTEIPLLLKADEIKVPSFDTTYIHSMAAVKFMLGK